MPSSAHHSMAELQVRRFGRPLEESLEVRDMINSERFQVQQCI
ncbi:MAG: hypothetical protein CM15mP102_03930 [Flavobacteriales bacterium]|nr:MAG: hypothetical protein CM15mP102_03930 [Flavobacteriales bacterium]